MFKIIKARKTCPDTLAAATKVGFSLLLARIVANRVNHSGINHYQGDFTAILQTSLGAIPKPNLLRTCDYAATRLALALARKESIGILTDYDVDGITSHALLHEALHVYFQHPSNLLQSFIGHRLNDGYGLSHNLVERILALENPPHLIITADCGSSDQQNIKRLKQAGIDVIVTDHHAIPAEGVPPSAYATVNPTQVDCAYPDAAIAGCMVAWLLMCQLRAKLIEQGRLPENSQKLSGLLDFVALGTIADAVSLFSPVNRAVVNTGLKIINHLHRPCWRAIHRLLNKQEQAFTVEDLGFQLGPRINARSRMADPFAALKFLQANNDTLAARELARLDKDNKERKLCQNDMLKTAMTLIKPNKASRVIVVYDPSFHAGVQGIVASRLVETFGKPVVVLSDDRKEGLLSGSARTIATVHIRQALQTVADLHPDLFASFGGHRGAAGLSIKKPQLSIFSEALESAIQQQIGDQRLEPVLLSDGELADDQVSLETLAEIEQLQPFGREFEAPCFEGEFMVEFVRTVGVDGVHLMMELGNDQGVFRAIWFNALESAQSPHPCKRGQHLRFLYSLNLNEYKGKRQLQLMVQYAVA